MISKDDWTSWKSHPVTKVYLDLVREAMADVEFIVQLNSVDETALMAAYQSGRRLGLQEALEMEPEDFNE